MRWVLLKHSPWGEVSLALVTSGAAGSWLSVGAGCFSAASCSAEESHVQPSFPPAQLHRKHLVLTGRRKVEVDEVVWGEGRWDGVRGVRVW